MLNEKSRTYLFLHYATDIVLVALSWVLATYLRFLFLDKDFTNFCNFLRLLPIPVLTAAFFLFQAHYYTSTQLLQAWHREFSRLILLNFNILVFFILIGYNLQSERISRLTLLFFFGISMILLIMNRIIFRNHTLSKMLAGAYRQSIFLIGHGSHVDHFVKNFHSNSYTGVSICGWADSDGGAEKLRIPSYSTEQIDEAVKELNPGNIVLGYTGKEIVKQDEYISSHYNQITPIILIPQVNYALIGTTIEEVQGIPLIFINQPNGSPVAFTVKRGVDILGSATGLLILSPFLLLIALLVKITSPGPVFYAQKRMTTKGRIFKMWKFRSMRQNADKEEGFTWTLENDPRRTRFGSFLRKTSMDELPQLWNVLKGDMSLVGPRPERPELIEDFKDKIPGYMLRHKMRAGITGWAQINGWRGNTSLEKRIEFDMYYIRNWELKLDIKILFLTIFNGFVNKNAY